MSKKKLKVLKNPKVKPGPRSATKKSTEQDADLDVVLPDEEEVVPVLQTMVRNKITWTEPKFYEIDMLPLIDTYTEQALQKPLPEEPAQALCACYVRNSLFVDTAAPDRLNVLGDLAGAVDPATATSVDDVSLDALHTLAIRAILHFHIRHSSTDALLADPKSLLNKISAQPPLDTDPFATYLRDICALVFDCVHNVETIQPLPYDQALACYTALLKQLGTAQAAYALSV